MPWFDYQCPECGVFDSLESRDAHVVKCACGREANRRPFSGLPNIKGETVAKNIPDQHYRMEAEKRDLAKKGWTGERSMEFLRKGRFEDKQGRKFVNVNREADSP